MNELLGKKYIDYKIKLFFIFMLKFNLFDLQRYPFHFNTKFLTINLWGLRIDLEI